MRRSATIVLSLFLVTAAGCSSGSEQIPRGPSGTDHEKVDATEAITRSIGAMAELDSYRMEFTFRPDGDALTFLVDHSVPNDYYERFLGTSGHPVDF